MDHLKKLKVTPELRRVLYLLLALVVAGGLVIALFLYLTRERTPEQRDIRPQVKLSAEDSKLVNQQAALFVNRFGSWGLRQDNLTGKNLQGAEYLMRQGSQLTATYWRSRLFTYEANRDELILLNSPLWYSSQVTSTWSDTYEQEQFMSFTPSTVKATPDPYQGTMTVQGQSVPVAQVQVTYDSKERVVVKTRDDELWDGSYYIMSKSFPSQLKLTFVRMGGVWKAYSLDTQTNPFTLTVWREPTDFTSTQFDFHRESTLKAEIK